MLRVGIAGINGRMGREIIASAADLDDVIVAGGLVGPGSARTLDSSSSISPAQLFDRIDVLVDFSTALAVAEHVRACESTSTPYVCGVTGLTSEQLEHLRRASTSIPVFYSRNMSIGIAVILSMLPDFARQLNAFDAEIVELHHRRKADAPSGSALALAEAIAAGRSVVAAEAVIHGRSGHAPRRPGEIGIHAVRGGGNAGEHSVLFAGEGEEIRIEHRALGRRTFADGAIRAARFTARQTPSFFQMPELLAEF